MTPSDKDAGQALVAILASDKELALTYHRRPLRFRVSQELFSSYQVDTGTRLLLKTVSDLAASDQVKKVLDLGCGYGPLGLAFAAADPRRLVHLVDRDALAVAFARHNAWLNKLHSAVAYGSLGYDDVIEGEFDLLLANIPGKAGPAALASFLLDARRVLHPDGLAAIVVVSPLAPQVADLLDRPDIEQTFRERGSEHVVFHFRFLAWDQMEEPPRASAFDRGAYERGQMTAAYRDLRLDMTTVHGLPEFDQLSHQTELLLSALLKIDGSKTAIGRALVFNPGQGHVPAALWRLLAPQQMIVVDRDLLGLRATARNLADNHCPSSQVSYVHHPALPETMAQPVDLILGVLRDSEGLQAHYALVEQAAALLAPRGELLLAGSSNTVTRLEQRIKQDKLLTVKQRKRNRAKRLLILKGR